ncbi:MAG: hypothetical protein COC24_002130 [Alphaproteobacteria bacterium]|nr:hypothetical protein [Alphaproteobacteria bacterium]
MDNQINDFEDSILEQAEKRRVQDFDDLQNELGGNDVGRIMRFLSADARAHLIEKRTGKNLNGLNALEIMLLTNPEYARAYEGAMNALEDAEFATERALIKLEAKLETAKAGLQLSLDNAAELTDGTKVFSDKGNKFKNENGDIIDDDLATQIELQGNEPSYETYSEDKNSVQMLENSIYEVRVYQTDVLGNARARLSNTTSPESKENVMDIKDNIRSQRPELVRLEMQNEDLSKTIQNAQHFEISEPQI